MKSRDGYRKGLGYNNRSRTKHALWLKLIVGPCLEERVWKFWLGKDLEFNFFVATVSSSGQEGQHAGPSSLPSCLHQRSGRTGHTSSTFHFPSAVNFIQCRLDFPSQPFECPLLASPIQPQYSRPNINESDQALVLSPQHRHYTMVAPWSSNIFSCFARSTRPVCRHAFAFGARTDGIFAVPSSPKFSVTSVNLPGFVRE